MIRFDTPPEMINPDSSGDYPSSTHAKINGFEVVKLTSFNYSLFRLSLSSYLGFRALDRWLKIPDDPAWDVLPDEPRYPSTHVKHLSTEPSSSTTQHSYNLRPRTASQPPPGTAAPAAPPPAPAAAEEKPTPPVATDYAERKYKALKEIQGTIRCLLPIEIISLLGGEDAISGLSLQRLLSRLDYHFNPPSVQRQLAVEYEL